MWKLQREIASEWEDEEFDKNEKVTEHNTQALAEKSLSDHILDVNIAYASGDMNEPYQEDMKVVEIEGEDV